MEIVTGALPSVIAKLGDLLIGEYNLQKRVKGEIRFLQAELESMKGALEKVSNTLADQLDIQDKIWAKDLRELSYDIEDSIDKFMVRDIGDESTKLYGIKKFIDRSVRLFRKAKVRHGIATEIEEIKSLVKEVEKRRSRYEVNHGNNKPATAIVDPRLFAHYTEVKDLVGIDETRDELIQILMEGNGVSMQGKIVSIVGFGGLGKTTLANAVFQKIRALYDCCAFVSVSQTPDLNKLFKGLLYDLGNNINEQALGERQLINVIREFLKPKRYFIVIDDIWDISIWKIIQCALPDNDVGYTIITTTRDSDVAEKVGTAYKLRPLSQNNSRKLLYKRIFGNEYRCNNKNMEKCPYEDLEEVSDRVLKKCSGVPLAIITMASLLACKARNKIDWYEVYNSIGTGLENNLDVENMRKILSFSYYNMPCHLRTCLLYLSVFPEDYEIQKDRLIQMWIAEGFIQCEKHGKSLVEVGESYFNELINRSMLQPVQDYAEMIHGCRVHDMVLDLIRSLSIEENLVTIINNMDDISPSNMIRRLSLQNGKQDDTMTWATRSLQQVRSVVVFPPATHMLPTLRSFHVLRVMDLQDCDLSHCYNLKHLGNLFHLRYLGLRKTNIAQVPEEIGNLQFLQTLDVCDNEISFLPSTIVQLKHLMCLSTENTTRLPIRVGSLTSLERLSVLGVDDSNIDILEELGQLTELRVLKIATLTEWNSKLVESLCKLQKIQDLGIWNHCGPRSMGGLDAWIAPRHVRSLYTQQGCWFSTLPHWMNPSLVPDLTELYIAIREVQLSDLDILGTLPGLRSLDLLAGHHKDLGILGRFVVGAGSFPCLIHCEFRGFVRPVVFEQGAMPKLRTFRSNSKFSVLEACSNGVGLDLGLGILPSLQEVKVWLDYKGASEEEAKELEAVLRHATKIHPNHPTLWVNGKRMHTTGVLLQNGYY